MVKGSKGLQCGKPVLYCWHENYMDKSVKSPAGFKEYKESGNFTLNCEIKRKENSGDKEGLVSNAYINC